MREPSCARAQPPHARGEAFSIVAQCIDIVMERIPDSVHEIFSMPNEVLEPYVHKVLDFFGTPALTVIGKDG